MTRSTKSTRDFSLEPEQPAVCGAWRPVRLVTVTITDDDLPPEVSFAEAAVSVGEGDGTTAVGVVLSAPSGLEVLVDFSAANGSANAGLDYDVANGTLTIAPGESTGSIEIAVLDDALDENDEDFTLDPEQSAIRGARRHRHRDGHDRRTTTCRRRSPSPKSAITATEDGDVVSLAVDLSSQSSFEITVDFATVGDTAVTGEDFVGTSGTLSIPAGETGGTIQLTIIDDVLDEGDEDLSIGLDQSPAGDSRGSIHHDHHDSGRRSAAGALLRGGGDRGRRGLRVVCLGRRDVGDLIV